MRILAKATLAVWLLAAGGCGSSLDGVSRAADSARNASERYAENADASNRAREAKIMEVATAIQEQADKKNKLPDPNQPHYELRKDNVGDSWTVYDTQNGRAIKVDSKSQSGLSHDEAEKELQKLVQADKAQDQLFGRQAR